MEEDLETCASLLIKCPVILNPESNDFKFCMSLEKTVGELKAELTTKHPCSPAVNDQRLIFRGQLLVDSITLAQMCQRAKSTELVLHMVLRSGMYKSTSSIHEEEQKSSISPRPSLMTTNVPNTIDNFNNTTNFTRRSVNATPTIATASASASASASFSTSPTISSQPRRGSGPTYYGIVNEQGQVVYTDISNAVIFDGRQFYVIRGGAIPANNSIPFTTSTIAGVGNGISHTGREQPAPAIDHRNRPAPRVINIDLAAVFSFLLRFGVIVLIFAQGGGKLKVAMLIGVFLTLFLIQAGVFNFLGTTRLAERLWEPIVRARRPPPMAGLDEGERQQQQQAPAQQQNENALLRNPFFKLFEIFTTFWLSLFPAEPPRIQENPAA